jgi:hypothetical protein
MVAGVTAGVTVGVTGTGAGGVTDGAGPAPVEKQFGGMPICPGGQAAGTTGAAAGTVKQNGGIPIEPSGQAASVGAEGTGTGG